jgi:hypothetical protein
VFEIFQFRLFDLSLKCSTVYVSSFLESQIVRFLVSCSMEVYIFEGDVECIHRTCRVECICFWDKRSSEQ